VELAKLTYKAHFYQWSRVSPSPRTHPERATKEIPMPDNCRGLWGDAGNNSKSQAKMSTTSAGWLKFDFGSPPNDI